MFKKLIAVLAALICLCSCGKTEVEKVPEEPVTQKVEEAGVKDSPEIQKTEEPPEEFVPITETVDYIPDYQRKHKSGLTEKDEPDLAEIDGIITMTAKCLSEKQKAVIIPLFQKENWTEISGYNGEEKCVSMVSFGTENGGIISAIYNEDKTLIQIKWGEHEEFRKFYHAPKEVFDDLWALYEKMEFSMEITNEYPETSPELLPDYDKYIKGDRFALNLSENYSEEEYFTDNNPEMMFDFAYELAKDAGLVGEDTYYPDYPKELVEKLISTYFLWDEEDIHNNVGKYQLQDDFYHFEGGYGSAAISPVLTKTEQNGDTVKLYLDIYCYTDENMDMYTLEQSSILTLKLSADGTWKYTANKIYFYRYF